MNDPHDTQRIRLTLVAPIYNEEAIVERFLANVVPICKRVADDYEIICVNDGSTDGTYDLLRAAHVHNPCIKVIDLSRNFGKEVALTAGLDVARGDAIIPIDADLQDPPELIPQMVAKWQEGYDVVLAVRSDRSTDTAMKRLTANSYYSVMQAIGDVRIPRNAGDFRLMDRCVVEALRRLPERTRFMKGLFAWLGFRQTQITYKRTERAAGQTKWKYWRLWNFALDGIFSFTTLPLRMWTYLGLAMAAFSALYGGFIIVRTLLFGVDVPGYASLLVVILFFSGLNMVGLGIMGEYLGRVFIEVKRRPLYLIRETLGIDEFRDRRP